MKTREVQFCKHLKVNSQNVCLPLIDQMLVSGLVETLRDYTENLKFIDERKKGHYLRG